MTASGPFAMGPTLAGSSSRRSVPRSNFAPVALTGPASSSSALGAGLTRTPAPLLKTEQGRETEGLRNAPDEDEDEVYSEPDEGVEIIDMENVRKMDWMAPESLRKEKKRMKLKKLRVKTEDTDQASNLKSKAKGISSALTLQSLTWLSI